MKPCSKQRKKIAWLALNSLGTAQTRDLHRHLESCPGCRAYWKKLSALTGLLSASSQINPIESSERFHQQVVRAVRNEPHNWTDRLFTRWPGVAWRVALPILAVSAVVGAVLLVASRSPQSSQEPGAPLAIRPAALLDLEPTVLNYQKMADVSLDRLDELLTNQGNRNPPSSPRLPDLAW